VVRVTTCRNASANRWARLLVGVVAILIAANVAVATASSEANFTFGIPIPHPGTTTVATSTFAYDARAIARIDVHKINVADARPPLPSHTWGRSAPQFAEARGTSTTSGTRSVATEAESGLVTAGETCNSFEHDTDVLMADGTRRPIDKVKVGDSVIATDPATGKTGPHAVTALIRHSTDHTIIDVSVAGADGVETIAATDHHPFYVTSNGGRWVDAGALAVGDELRSPDGTQRVIVGVTTRPAHETVYNLTIDGVHTYYVGDGTPVLVHNSGPCWPVQVGGNCSACAAEIQGTLGGGEIMRLEPLEGQVLGPSVNNPAGNWSFHDVVLKDGLVFDSFTGPTGMPLSDFLQQFKYSDAIRVVAP
jgi:Pretoxin HINT domain